MQSTPLNLKSTITEVVRALSYTNLERGLSTNLNLQLDPELLVLGDPVRLHQIFMNLLSNSYKFTSKGSVTISARTIATTRDSIEVICSVADTGIGISQEQVSRLFTPFSQADSSTQRSYGGSGLGLSICRALINVLGGKIELESQLGMGTTVSFTVAFLKAPIDTKAIDSKDVVDTTSHSMATWSSDSVPTIDDLAGHIDLSLVPRDKLRVCVAEDNPINQKIAVSFVTKLGFKCKAYNDGLQAVEGLRAASAQNDPFHLVLMDCQMPVLDGYDATRLIRRDEDEGVRRVLIIAMTASAIRGDKEKCLEAGMNDYLAKPVRANVLKSMLDGYLVSKEEALAVKKAATEGTEVLAGEDGAAISVPTEGNSKAGAKQVNGTKVQGELPQRPATLEEKKTGSNLGALSSMNEALKQSDGTNGSNGGQDQAAERPSLPHRP